MLNDNPVFSIQGFEISIKFVPGSLTATVKDPITEKKQSESKEKQDEEKRTPKRNGRKKQAERVYGFEKILSVDGTELGIKFFIR
jgi:ribosomal protein S2